jgi:hypothetical protein
MIIQVPEYVYMVLPVRVPIEEEKIEKVAA